MAGQLLHFSKAGIGLHDRTRMPGRVIVFPTDVLVAREERFFHRIAAMQFVSWLPVRVRLIDRFYDQAVPSDWLFKVHFYFHALGSWKEGSTSQIALHDDGPIVTFQNVVRSDDVWIQTLSTKSIGIESNGIRAAFNERGRVHLTP